MSRLPDLMSRIPEIAPIGAYLHGGRLRLRSLWACRERPFRLLRGKAAVDGQRLAGCEGRARTA
jgi:hypothetical protein